MKTNASNHGHFLNIAAVLITTACLSLSCKKAGPTEFLYVAHKDGTGLYISADLKSTISHINCSEKVGILSKKSVGGTALAEVQWGDKNGWVTEKTLTPDANSVKCVQPEESSITPGPVIKAGSLEEAVKKYLQELYTKEYKKEGLKDKEIGELIDNIYKKGITIKMRLGNFAVVHHGTSSDGHSIGSISSISSTDSLWHKWGDGWREYITGTRIEIHLGHINNDNFPDALLQECPDECYVKVYIGKDDNSMTQVQKDFGEENLPHHFNIKLGRCGGTTFEEGGKVVATFDCARNKLVMIK